MSTDSTDQHHFRRNLPDVRQIYDLITSNDLPAISSIFTPLTLRDRESIVYQKIHKRTLLYHASDLGFIEIVKYLIDECGADPEDGYYPDQKLVPPLSVAIRKLDFRLITLLLRRGININGDIRDDLYVNLSFENRYFSLMSILKLYKNKLNKTNLLVSKEQGGEYRGVYIFSWVSELTFQTRSFQFFMACSTGNIGKMKVLLEQGIDKNYKDSNEENPLCAAILNHQTDTVNFCLNSRLYSLRSYVIALEFCGAVYIIFRSDKQEGLRCWRESLRIRREYSIGFEDKRITRLDTDLGVEFESDGDIDGFQSGYKAYTQSLIVFRRQLSRFSLFLQNAYITVAKYNIFEGDLLEPVQILAELYDLPCRNFQGVDAPPSQAVATILYIYSSHFHTDTDDETIFLSGFERLFDFLNAKTWAGLLRGGHEFYRIAYSELLDIALTCITSMDNYDLSDEIRTWIKEGFKKAANLYNHPFPTTLLHRAILGSYTFQRVSFLLNCSADANCVDAYGSTPLHFIAQLPVQNQDLHRLTHLLIDAGAHVDSVNVYGHTPLELLQTKGVIQCPTQYITLQCLAAQTIAKNEIHMSHCPKVLVKFVRLHSASSSY